jgi:tetraacyldisaccharide 4'-kinase
VRVVSLGQGPVLGPKIAGDEPVLLAGLVRGASVVVGPDRYEAGRHALERISPQPRVFLLDDGFSHVRLARNLDLLTFPAADPFAAGRLWPGGRLREPLRSVRHADAVLFTDAESPDDGERLARVLRPFGFTGRGFSCATRILDPVTVHGDPLPRAATVFLVSAIARAERFVSAAKRQSVQVRGALHLDDHDPYTDKTLEEIEAAFRASGADWVLTTAKDRVKIFGRVNLPLAELPIAAELDDGFWTWFDAGLDAALETVRG